MASRIGAVRGDVVGIEILERGAGRAIDELVVQLPDASLVSLLVSEVAQVDGVDVEDVRPVALAHDARLDALETAAVLVASPTLGCLMAELVSRARRDFEADWVATVELEGASVLASEGSPPDGPWLVAFVGGSRSSAALVAGDGGPDDVAWAALSETGLAETRLAENSPSDADMALVLGRKGRPFRARERRQLAALARIAGLRAEAMTPGAAPPEPQVAAQARERSTALSQSR